MWADRAAGRGDGRTFILRALRSGPSSDEGGGVQRNQRQTARRERFSPCSHRLHEDMRTCARVCRVCVWPSSRVAASLDSPLDSSFVTRMIRSKRAHRRCWGFQIQCTRAARRLYSLASKVPMRPRLTLLPPGLPPPPPWVFSRTLIKAPRPYMRNTYSTYLLWS